MLGTYEAQLTDPTSRALSFVAASATILAVFAAAQRMASVPRPAREKPVEVTFVERKLPAKVEAAPPPPPPPVVIVQQAPPPAAAVVPRNIKKIMVSKPVKLKALAAPRKMDKGPLAEADPSQEKGVAVYAGASEDPAAYGSGGDVFETAVVLPEEATPPRPLATNVMPEFPAAAKTAGLSGMVILKIVVAEDGSVAAVKVLRGDEPFVTSAVSAVKTWRYEPARQGDRVIPVVHIVKIPFQLQT